MQEYKICPFCGKATAADNDTCTFCNGFVKYARLDCTGSAGAAVINNSTTGEIMAVGDFSPYDFTIIQPLALLSSMLFLGAVAISLGGSMPGPGIMLPLIVSLIVTWLLFGRFLRKFTGTGRIASPLIKMNVFYLSAIVLTGVGILTMGTLYGAFLFLSALVAVITGFILFIVSAVRMGRVDSGPLRLNTLGSVIIVSSVFHIFVRLVLLSPRIGITGRYMLESLAAVYR